MSLHPDYTPGRLPAGPPTLPSDPALAACQAWFQEFSARYPDSDTYRLKTQHTWRVLAEARLITTSQDGWLVPTRLIHLAALLHDVGRFPQLERFGTLSDRHSANHAYLGVRVLRQEGVLDHLPREERRLVLGAVQLHNRRWLPAGLTPRLTQAVRALRDADKLDVLGLVVERLRPGMPLDPNAFPGLRDHPTQYTPQMLAEVAAGRLARIEEVKWRSDAVLLFASWVYDLNFAVTRREVAHRGYLEQLLSYLPPDPNLTSLWERLRAALSSA